MKRPIRIEGEIAYVPLTRGHEAIIDAADIPLVGGFNWQALVGPHTVYATRTDYSGRKKRTVMLHRVLLDDPGRLDVDHQDGNGLNNRRCNLRGATRSQNLSNQRIRSNNTSGFKGVSRNKARAKWMAYIALHGKQHHLGYYDTPEAAHAAYVEASARLHGEFGRAA